MSEKNYTSKDVEDAARRVGFSPSKTTKEIRQERSELLSALQASVSSETEESSPRTSEARRPSRTRRAIGAIAAAGALVAGGAALIHSTDKGMPTSGETATYTVQPGDTADDLGHLIEAAHDGVAENEDARPMIDNLVTQSNNDGQPGLQVGEQLQVPASSDIYADIEGVQLTHK